MSHQDLSSDYLHADYHYRRAQQLGARNGSPFEVTGGFKIGWKLAVFSTLAAGCWMASILTLCWVWGVLRGGF